MPERENVITNTLRTLPYSFGTVFPKEKCPLGHWSAKSGKAIVLLKKTSFQVIFTGAGEHGHQTFYRLKS